MADDDLATQGASASAAMVLTYFSLNILVWAQERINSNFCRAKFIFGNIDIYVFHFSHWDGTGPIHLT